MEALGIMLVLFYGNNIKLDGSGPVGLIHVGRSGLVIKLLLGITHKAFWITKSMMLSCLNFYKSQHSSSSGNNIDLCTAYLYITCLNGKALLA